MQSTRWRHRHCECLCSARTPDTFLPLYNRLTFFFFFSFRVFPFVFSVCCSQSFKWLTSVDRAVSLYPYLSFLCRSSAVHLSSLNSSTLRHFLRSARNQRDVIVVDAIQYDDSSFYKYCTIWCIRWWVLSFRVIRMCICRFVHGVESPREYLRTRISGQNFDIHLTFRIANSD